MSDTLKLDYQLVEMLANRPTDICDHLKTLYNLVCQMGARVVVELGAGQSSFVFAAAVRETSGNLWTIDKIALAHLWGFPEGEGALEAEPRVTIITDDDMKVIVGWCTWINFLFIDTSHQYEHTLAELRTWGKWVKVGGQIAMHDTNHKIGHAVDCRKALDHFLEVNPGKFEAYHRPGCGGLSVLTKKKE